MILSWNVNLPKHGSLWETVVSAYEREKNRKAVAAGIDLSQKQLDKMIAGTEGRQLAVRRLEDLLDAMEAEGRQEIVDYLDWKYRVPSQQKSENINGQVKDLMSEVHRLLDLHEHAEGKKIMSLSLFRVGKVFHYRYQVAGVRVQRTTRETTKARAEEVAWKAYRATLLEIRGEEGVPALRELASRWRETNEPIASASHLRALEGFSRLHLYGMGNTRIDQIRTEDVEEARAKHLESGHAPATANHWLRNLKLLFHWAVARKMLPSVPWSVRMMKLQKRPRVILPIAKAAAWLNAIDDAAGEDSAVGVVVRLMLGLGLREMEALGARWEWVDLARKTYTPGKTKGREADPVPMPGWLAEFLAARAQPEGYIAPAPDGLPFASGYTRRAFVAANQAVGVPGLTPHRLRGTFATLLSEAGVPVQDIQKVMRHKDLKTTLGYLEPEYKEVAHRLAVRRMKTRGPVGPEDDPRLGDR